MSKRIIAMLLAVITILQTLSGFPAIVGAEEPGEVSVVGMQAQINTADPVYMYGDVTYDGPSSKTDRTFASELPETMIILETITVSYGTVFYKLGTIDGSSHSFLDKYPWIKAALVNVISTPVPDDGLVRGEVHLKLEGSVISYLELSKGEKITIFTELSDKFQGTPTYRWQMLVDRETNSWANIPDYVLPYAPISEALIFNAKDSNGIATIRCIATYDKVQYVSGEVQVSVEDTLSAEPQVSLSKSSDLWVTSSVDEGAGDVELIAFSIAVFYTYRHASAVDNTLDKRTAADTHTVTRPVGGSYTGTITSPPVVGYKPYVTAGEDNFNLQFLSDEAKNNPITYDGETYYPANILDFVAVEDDTVINVYYIPQKVQFLVKYYEQNLHNDEYVLAGTEIKQGLADSSLGEGHDKAKTGFSALFYDPTEPISGDSSTELAIYYDRNYYLINFDLNGSDAYGATPFYVRYNSQVMLPSPTNPGYSFNEWNLDRVYLIEDDGNGNSVEVDINDASIKAPYNQKGAGKMITVQHNVNYTAKWTIGDTSYTIAYWLEDPNFVDGVDPESEKYKYWGFETVTGARTGSVVDGPGANDVPASLNTTFRAKAKAEVDREYTINELNFLQFSESDQDVTVKGDGSTVVNVYYDRKEYTLKFYYARAYRNNNNWNNVTWAICGRSNQFGNEAGDAVTKTDEISLLSNMASTDFGNVEKQPTLKAGLADKYTMSYDENGRYRYYYLSFKAKYGADISDLYPCDVFDSVNRTSGNSTNTDWGNSHQAAIMSAWTPENNVLFSYAGGNQTMKGKYQVFNYVMLWHPTSSNINETTVSYLCFWENASSVGGWNVPELYRYKIWLPVYDGQDTSGLTTYRHNNVTYYLADSYDTCDNSQVSEQTQPILKGFTSNGYTSHGNIYGWNFTINNTTITQAERDEITSTAYRNLYNEAFVVNYFYTRNTYNLSFSDQYTTPEVLPIPYEQSLAKYTNKVPDYPSNVETGAMYFEGNADSDGVGDGTGWYLDENCTVPFSFNITMGAENIQLYANWIPTSHNIKVYRQESEIGSTVTGELLLDKTVNFGTQVLDDELAEYVKPNDAFIFAGWYYIEDGVEKRYDFNTMVVKHDLVIYAKWTSHVPVDYVIYYQSVIDGVVVDIATPTRGQSLAGISKTFTPKVDKELFDSYNVKFFPELLNHSMKMSLNEAENVYTFRYFVTDKIEYKIVHQFVSESFEQYIGTDTFSLELTYSIEGNNLLTQSALKTVYFDTDVNRANVYAAAEKAAGRTLNNNEKDGVWKTVTQLSPNFFQQDLILTTNPSLNVVVFNWAGRELYSIYQVIHYFQTVDGKYYAAEIQSDYVGNIGDTAVASPIERYGFQFNADYTEKQDTNTTMKDGKLTGQISKVVYQNNTWKGILILKLYYNRDQYNYTVHYRNFNNETIADSVTKKGYFGSIVNVSDPGIAKDITGYKLSNGSLSIEISQNNQEIICYYEGLEVNYYYQIGGSNGAYIDPVTNEVVKVGSDPQETTITLLPGYILEDWHYKVSGSDQEYDVPDEWLSNNDLTVTLPTAPAEWAGKAVNVYAVVVPTRLTLHSVIEDVYAGTYEVDVPDWVVDNQGFIYHIQGVGADNSSCFCLFSLFLDSRILLFI